MTYAPVMFEIATSNSLGGDTFTRNMIDGLMQGQTDFGTKLIYPFFLKKKTGIIKLIGYLNISQKGNWKAKRLHCI